MTGVLEGDLMFFFPLALVCEGETKNATQRDPEIGGWIDNTASSDSFHGQSDFILTPGIRIVLDPSRS